MAPRTWRPSTWETCRISSPSGTARLIVSPVSLPRRSRAGRARSARSASRSCRTANVANTDPARKPPARSRWTSLLRSRAWSRRDVVDRARPISSTREVKLRGSGDSTTDTSKAAARSTAWLPTALLTCRSPPSGVVCRTLLAEFHDVGPQFHRASVGSRKTVSQGFPARPGDARGVAMFQNKMPRYEILSEDAIEVLDKGWKRLVSEIGVEFLSDRALDLFRAAGQKVEDNNVFFDPDFLLEQVAKAPREFDVQARNPAHTVHIGGDSMAFGGVYGPPFVREGDVRRDATMDDFRNFSKLAQSFTALDSAGGVICEPNDAPLDSRHLDMVYALQTLTDKIYMGNVVSGANARDTIAMSEILFGGREAIERTPATISLINCNSPLRWDDRMLDAQFE